MPDISDLHALLNAIHANQKDNTLKLVAADCADELDMVKLSALFRWIVSNEFSGEVLSTGSRSYGTPTESSDWDWVVWANVYKEEKWLKDNAEFKCTGKQFVDYAERNGEQLLVAAYRFGPVNVITVANRKQWKVWEEGTKDLIAERDQLKEPRTRDRAIVVFQSKGDKYLRRGLLT